MISIKLTSGNVLEAVFSHISGFLVTPKVIDGDAEYCVLLNGEEWVVDEKEFNRVHEAFSTYQSIISLQHHK